MKNSEPERLARGLDLSNPAFVFAFVWLLALVLTTLRWTTQLIGIPQSLRWLILGNIATITLWYIGFSALNSGFQRRLSGLPTAAELHQLEGFARVVGWFAIAGSLFEVIVGRGVPLQWLLVGDTTRDYRDFGIPTFHGLVTSAYMFYTTTRIVLFAATGRRMAIWHGVLLLAWPLVIINRAGFVWTLFQMAGAYLIVRRVTTRAILVLVATAASAIMVFGLVGDARVGVGRVFIDSIISSDAPEVLKIIPSGFIWAYVYITSSVNNLAAGIGQYEPLWVPYFSTKALFPSIIGGALFNVGARKYSLGLVNEALNTSSAYAGLISDFGVFGAGIATALLQLVAVWLYFRAKSGEVWAILGFAIAFEAMALSPFADTFTSLVAVFQLFLVLLYKHLQQSASHISTSDVIRAS